MVGMDNVYVPVQLQYYEWDSEFCSATNSVSSELCPITHENVNIWVNRYFGVSSEKPQSTYCVLILACGQA